MVADRDGVIMVTPLPGITEAKPGSAMRAFPGIKAVVVNDEGAPVERGESGFLTIQRPWPSMLRTLWQDDKRYIDTYWSRFGNEIYFAGDGARREPAPPRRDPAGRGAPLGQRPAPGCIAGDG
jgi:acetyl-CoA synthetase